MFSPYFAPISVGGFPPAPFPLTPLKDPGPPRTRLQIRSTEILTWSPCNPFRPPRPSPASFPPPSPFFSDYASFWNGWPISGPDLGAPFYLSYFRFSHFFFPSHRGQDWPPPPFLGEYAGFWVFYPSRGPAHGAGGVSRPPLTGRLSLPHWEKRWGTPATSSVLRGSFGPAGKGPLSLPFPVPPPPPWLFPPAQMPGVWGGFGVGGFFQKNGSGAPWESPGLLWLGPTELFPIRCFFFAGLGPGKQN